MLVAESTAHQRTPAKQSRQSAPFCRAARTSFSPVQATQLESWVRRLFTCGQLQQWTRPHSGCFGTATANGG